MRKNSKRQLNATVEMRLERLEAKTNRVLDLLNHIYKQMNQRGNGSKDWAEAVNSLEKATNNLVAARARASK